MFYGLDWVATVPPTVKLAAQHFGAGKGGLVFGWIFAGHQLGRRHRGVTCGGRAAPSLDSPTCRSCSVVGVVCMLAAVLILTIEQAAGAAACCAATA